MENSQSCPLCALNRRQFLRSGLYLAAAGAAVLSLPPVALAQVKPPWSLKIAPNGSPEPFPIPWLDKNGNHNQSPGPEMEPSNIYHFKGRVARANGFTGLGRDNHGNRLAFGTPTTDFSFMQGEYVAARVPQPGAFAHI